MSGTSTQPPVRHLSWSTAVLGGEDGDVHPSRPGHSADEEGEDSECVQQPAEYEEPENEDGPNTSECVRERNKGDLPAPM